MTILNVRDANTGDFVEVNLDNPSGTIYVNDYNTGEVIPIPFSSFDWSDHIHDEDLKFPATAINPPGAASDPTRNNTDGSLEFSATAVNTIAFFVQVPHDWVIGTNMRFHVHWQPTTTNVGNVVWRFTYNMASINDNFVTASGIDLIDSTTGSATQHLMTDMAQMPMSGIGPSAMFKCLLSRLGNDNRDTYTGAAKLVEADIHYDRYGHGYTFGD